MHQAKHPEFVGHAGILVKETYNTLMLLRENDRLVTVPKRNVIFALRAPLGPAGPTKCFLLYGNALAMRSSDRSTRKFKQKLTIDM